MNKLLDPRWVGLKFSPTGSGFQPGIRNGDIVGTANRRLKSLWKSCQMAQQSVPLLKLQTSHMARAKTFRMRIPGPQKPRSSSRKLVLEYCQEELCAKSRDMCPGRCCQPATGKKKKTETKRNTSCLVGKCWTCRSV